MKSVNAVGAITTPAACVPTLLDRPSSFKAISKTSLDSSDSSIVSLNCLSLYASSRLIPKTSGIALASLSPNPYGFPNTLTTSLNTALAAMVPLVLI